VLLSPDLSRRVLRVDTMTAGMMQPPGTVTLVAGSRAPSALRFALQSLRVGDTVDVDVDIVPERPLHAVGGRPVVVKDGAVTRAARDSNAFSLTRHPRTAVGIADQGRRVFLVVVDGRQPDWSAGMSLLELAH